MTRPGARRAGLALLAGVLLYGGHPPIGLAAAGFVALVPLVALSRELARDGVRARVAFGYGFLAGATFFGPLLYWLIPFGYAAFGLLTLVQSAYLGVVTALLTAYGERRGRAAVTVAIWVGLEALRGVWPFGGLAWGGLAYTQADGGLALGVARTLGAAGISAVLATVAVAVEEAIRGAATGWAAAREEAVPADAVFRRIRTPLLTVLGVLAVAVLLAGSPPAPTGRTTSFGIVQAGDTRATSAAGVTRIDTGRIVRVAELMVEATAALADDPPDVVIWPENALDGDIRQPRWAEVEAMLEAGVDLVDPAPILAGESIDGTEPATRFNAMTVFTADGIGESYRKRRPVPFGEYVPLRSWLDWFPPLEQIPSDVVPGDGPQVVHVGGAAVGNVICFENTFGHLVRDQVHAGADVLVVSTNNSSFGDTPMSSQHIAFSQVRAVETGRWVVHAGISGISGFVDPEGVVHQRTELFERATPVMDVPLVEGRTPAMRIGDAVAWLAGAVAVLGLAAVVVDRRRAG
ncbi:apolipoprotein N-acyltransferase [Euzebya sp.]|uniref:apolipoprotein N-acyltransferase n=1 Tax=Euzebya sp. TaxID=1971409 RepID=UPI003515ACFF